MYKAIRSLLVPTAVAALLAAMLYAGWNNPPTPGANFTAGQVPSPAESPMTEPSPQDPPVQKTEAQWREQLTPEQYHVLREQGTERPFSGEYWDHKDDGSYYCAACGELLFDSRTKFDSGCGWPSFYEIADDANIGTTVDRSHFMVRTEVHCNNCGAHLGHVFPDGPEPTGQRYCINSVSMQFQPRDEAAEEE